MQPTNSPAPSLNDTPGFWRTIFDASPIPTFIVDADLHILDTNQSAGQLLDGSREFVLRHRTGEVLRCVHSTETPGGCGRSPACKKCAVRSSVNQAFAGQPITRQRARMELLSGDKARTMDILVTTAPIAFAGRQLALLMLEDVTELMTLRKLIPICARCKSIRDDQAFWHGIEHYLHTHLDLGFTHGMCPKCIGEMYPDLYPQLPSVEQAAEASEPKTA
jgi:hypothetical protein